MDTNRCHRAGGCALEARRMAIALPGELQESVGPGSEDRAWQVRGRSAIFLQNIALVNMPWNAVWRGWRRSMDTNRCHRASRCALEGPGRPIRVPGEFQESEGPCTNQALRAVRGSSMSFGDLPAKHRASQCVLECCLEGFASLDGHKSVPSRRRMCPGGP